MKRRHFLHSLGGALTAQGLARSLGVTGSLTTLQALARSTPAVQYTPQRRLILIYLMGGNDGFNTVIPYADPAYHSLRPNIAVARDQIIQLSERQGLHPNLAPLLPAWKAGELAWLQGIGLADIHDQHYSDYERLVTGAGKDEYLADGWASRALQAGSARRLLDAVALDSLDIREGDAMGPFRGQKLKVVNAPHPSEVLGKRDLQSSVHVITPALQGRPLPRFEALALKTAFSDEPFGHALHAAVELAKAQPDLPVIHITLDALDGDRHHCFDTHWKQASYQPGGLSRLAAGLAALRAALVETGLWDSTLVTTYDEFGRSPRENKEQGTEHGWSNTHLVMGGRVKGGLLGRAPKLVDVHWIGGDKPVIDYRQFYTTLIESWWGQSASGMFSERFKPLDLLRA